MRTQNTPKYLSKFFEPTRVFIALMVAVTAWLFPFISFKEKTVTPIEHGVIVSADPFTAGAIGECSDVHCEPGFCCVKGYCKTGGDNCGPGDPPPPAPPSISASLNCSDPGDNGWCKGSVSLDIYASDPQGEAVDIYYSINGDSYSCTSGDTSCSISMVDEGTGSIDYQVNSATGLSAAGSTGYQIDVSNPDLNASVNGTPGTSPWYVSNVTLSASASDSISGLATIETSVDSGGWTTYGGPLTLTDGIHTVSVRAIDYAGNVSQTNGTIQVDTITPSLSFSTSGTSGNNGWYVSDATATPSASDSGSGIRSIEASVDGGGWSAVGSLSFTDGVHTYKFRAIDHAGNITETPLQYLNVDTTPPSITMSQGTSLGDEVKYKIEDYGSGLSIYRAIIEDNGAQYQKAVWAGNISGKIIQSKILWDGKFADTQANVGQYMITMKVTDAAGNQSIETSYVSVNLLSFLQDLSGSTPPNTTQPDSGGESSLPFNGTTTTFATGNTPNPFANGAVLAGVGSASNHSGQTQPGNLLGTLGLVAAGTLAYETYRRRQEDEQQVLNTGVVRSNVSAGGILASPVRVDPPPPVEPTPPIDDGDDDDKRDVVVTATPNPYVPVPTQVPIAPGTPVIRSTPPLTREQVETGMGALVDSANVMVSHGTPSTLARLGLEVPANASSLETTMIRSVDRVIAPIQDLVDDINLCVAGNISVGRVALNVVERIDSGLSNASIATALTSIAGNAMVLMGIQHGQTVADVGTVSGAVVDAGSMVTGITRLVGSWTTGSALPAAGVLAKVGGAIAIPLGAITFGVEGYKATTDYLEDKQLSREGTASAWNAAGGFLTMAGGICMFIPAAGPVVGGVLLAAGGVCSGISWYVQHQEQVNAFVSNSWNSVKNTVNTTVTNVKNTVTQAANTAKNTAVKIVAKVTETVAKTITKVTETVKNTVTNTVKTVTNIAKNIVTNTFKAVTEAPKNIVKAVTNTVKTVTNTVKAVTKTVKAVAETAKNTFKSVGNTISKWFKPKR